MKSMKAFVLFLGDMYSESNYIVMGDTTATAANPTASHRLIHSPSSAVLIDHPEAGWIMYDTGMPDNPEATWPKNILDIVVVNKPKHSRMDYQLSLVGIKPKDIKHVITSHMHMDHVGNDKLFADTANFYVGKEEAAHAYRTVLQSPDPEKRGWYIKDEVLLTRKKVTYVDRDEELFPGVKVITLPGHTPCMLGIVIHLKDSTIIFTSDSVNEKRNYNGQLPGVMHDSLGYVESLRKIKYLQKRYDARVFFGHDALQLSEEVKKAPDYYN